MEFLNLIYNQLLNFLKETKILQEQLQQIHKKIKKYILKKMLYVLKQKKGLLFYFTEIFPILAEITQVDKIDMHIQCIL